MTFFGYTREDARITRNFFLLTLRDRYLGSRIGIMWSLINPLILMGIYTFVFGFIFKSRLPGSETSLSFVVWLISGYAPWLAISEGIISSTNSVVTGSTMIKNIVFKTEILPVSYTLTGLFPMVVGLFVLIILLMVSGMGISIHILWLVLIIPLQMFFLIGLGYFLSALTVFIRDITHIIGSILMVLIFFTPIFYSVDMMPAIIRKVSFFNPFYQVVDLFRSSLVYQKLPDFYGMLYLFLVSLVLWYFGLKFFRKLKGYFQSCL